MRIAAAKEVGVLRWSVSVVLALALHVLAIGMFLAEGHAGEPAEPSAPIMLELIVLPIEPEVVSDETAAEPSGPPTPPADLEVSVRDPIEPPQTCDPQTPKPSASAAATLAEWKSLLRRHLEHYKQYPADAQRAGQQGTPHVFFTVCHDGRVLAAHIVRTSGVASLDQAGMDLVRRAAPLPAFPQGLSEDTVNLIVPVEFLLARAGH